MPDELTLLRGWVMWRYELDPKRDKWTKPPRQVSGHMAMTNKPDTWAAYDDVKAAYERGGWDGVGFVLGASPGVAGLDLDHCLDPTTGEMEGWASEVLALLPGTHTERSPGGDGLRIFVKGHPPRCGKGGPGNRLEIYDEKSPRYLTLTGRTTAPHAITEHQAGLEAIHERFMTKPTHAPTPTPTPTGTGAPPRDQDADIIDWLAERYNHLWGGAADGDASSGDLALCNILAWRTQGAAVAMDRIFRQSGRMRPKWDERHSSSGETYGQMTIEKALAGNWRTSPPPGTKGRPQEEEADDPFPWAGAGVKRDQAQHGDGVGSKGGDSRRSSWPSPLPIPSDQPKAPPFDYDLLPEALRPWIKDIAERIQCPPDFAAVGAMVVLGSLMGRRVGIRPKRQDDWLVVPNLWGAVIGRPSAMKSPALAGAMMPIKRILSENKAAQRKQEQDKPSEDHPIVLEMKIKHAKKAIEQAVKNEDPAEMEAQAKVLDALQSREADVKAKAKLPTLHVNDPSIEALGEVLAENPNGVLLFRDELVGWLRGLDREGAENARPLYLESWNGTGSYDYHRIGRGHIHIPALCVSILGGIQPGPLTDYVREASRNGQGADGLLQRFQMIVWPDDTGEWRNVDRWPDTAAKNAAFEVFRRLYDLNWADIGAQAGECESDVPFLRFADEAQVIFDEWLSDLHNNKLKSAEREVLESHLSKYRKLIPALALACHLADNPGGGPVDATSILRACAWGEYLEGHARKIYAIATGSPVAAARELARRIQDGSIKDGDTVREIGRKHWRNLTTTEEVQSGVDLLEDLRWLRVKVVRAIGRPSAVISINPQVMGAA